MSKGELFGIALIWSFVVLAGWGLWELGAAHERWAAIEAGAAHWEADPESGATRLVYHGCPESAAKGEQ